MPTRHRTREQDRASREAERALNADRNQAGALLSRARLTACAGRGPPADNENGCTRVEKRSSANASAWSEKFAGTLEGSV
jgi:hypothetical protein